MQNRETVAIVDGAPFSRHLPVGSIIALQHCTLSIICVSEREILATFIGAIQPFNIVVGV